MLWFLIGLVLVIILVVVPKIRKAKKQLEDSGFDLQALDMEPARLPKDIAEFLSKHGHGAHAKHFVNLTMHTMNRAYFELEEAYFSPLIWGGEGATETPMIDIAYESESDKRKADKYLYQFATYCRTRYKFTRPDIEEKVKGLGG